jgi:integrase
MKGRLNNMSNITTLVPVQSNEEISSLNTERNLNKNKKRILKNNVTPIGYARIGKKSGGRLYTRDGRRTPSAAEPFRNKEDIIAVRNYFLNSDQKFKYRNYLLFVLGINIGERISDLLDLRVNEVYNFSTGQVYEQFRICEGKTSKLNNIYINRDARGAIELYLREKNKLETVTPNEYLFGSWKSDKMGQKQMKRQTAWKILNDTVQDLGLNMQHVGSHSLRKTFGYIAYNNSGRDYRTLNTLQAKFKHRNQDTTLTYIGITEEEVKNLYDDVGCYYDSNSKEL